MFYHVIENHPKISHKGKYSWHIFALFSDCNPGVLLTKNLYAILINRDSRTPTADEEKMRLKRNYLKFGNSEG